MAGGGSLSMPTVVQRVEVDASGVRRGAADVKSHGKTISSFFSGLTPLVKGASIAVGALALGKFLNNTVKQASESQQVMVKFNASMAASGLVTKAQTENLSKYADAVQMKTRFDDESVRSGEAQLSLYKLTGDQIQSTIPLVVDYAARTGKDVPAAAKLVGSALLGNTRGLKQIGIEFKATGDRTKDLAKIQDLLRAKVGGFAEKEGKTYAGRVAEMKNLTQEFQESLGKLLLPALTAIATVVVEKVMPQLLAFSKWIETTAVPVVRDWVLGLLDAAKLLAQKWVMPVWDDLKEKAIPVLHDIKDTFHDMEPTLAKNHDLFMALATGLATFAGALAAMKAGGGVLTLAGGVTNLLGSLAAFGAPGLIVAGVLAIAAAFTFAFVKIKPFHDAVVENRDALLLLASTVIVGPIGIIAAAFVEAYQKVQPFRDAVDAVVDVIRRFATESVAWITGTFVPAVTEGFQSVMDFISTAEDTLAGFGENIITFLQPAVDWINANLVPVFVAVGELFAAIGERMQQVFDNVIQPIASAIGEVLGIQFQLLAGIATAAWNTISTVITIALKVVLAAIEGFIGIVEPIWSIVWNALFNIVSTVFTQIRIIVETVLGVVRGIINIATALIRGDWGKAWEGVKAIFSSIWSGIRDTAKNVIDGIVDFVRGLPKRIEALIGGITDAAKKIGSALKDGIVEGVKGAIRGALDLAGALEDAFKAAWNFLVDKLNTAANNLKLHIPWPIDKDIGLPPNPFNILKLAQGALVTKPTLALIGEAGPELVTPLTRGSLLPARGVTPLEALPTGGSGETNNWTFNVTGPNVIDMQTLERAQRRANMMRLARGGAA